MELHRASLIQNTPPSTPRNSMLLVPTQTASSNNSQMFNLQEFLTRFEPEESPAAVHREMEEAESHQHVRSRLRSSQQSVSQGSNRSKSSTSLHSAPSSTSITRESADHHVPVIANPAALNSNLNNNNSNNNNSNGSEESAPVVGTANHNMTAGSVTLVEGERSTGNDVGPNSSTPNYPKAVSISQAPEVHSVISWGDASSIGSRSLSSSSTSDVRFAQGGGSQNQLVPPCTTAPREVNSAFKPRSYSVSAAGSKAQENGVLPKSESNEALKKSGKSKSKGRSLFRRHFHRSSDDLLEEPKAAGNASKPPLVQRKFHKSAFDLVEAKRRQPEAKKRVDFSETETEAASNNALSLSRLTDLRHRGELSNVQLPGGAARGGKKTKNSKKRNAQPKLKTVAPSRSQECLQDDHSSNNGSDELVSLTDMLSELDPTSLSQPTPRPLPPSSPRSPGQESIWQEYGCV